ncbi:MAG TPA: hypothetical protein VJ346_09180, partial [Bacteroidales bacterium]|nr:hypothetical protein [Bacteroidales bacterium]
MARLIENKNNGIITEEMNLDEYRIIGKILELLSSQQDLENSLQLICNLLPEAYQQHEYVYARIIFDDNEFTSKNFTETTFLKSKDFEIPNDKKGVIQLFFHHQIVDHAEEKPFSDDNPFLNHVSALVAGSISRTQLKDLHYKIKERLKELTGINLTTRTLKDGQSLEESLQKVCSLLPEAWQYPEHTAVRITYGKKVFVSTEFKETPWTQKQTFEAPRNKKGLIEIFYLKEFPQEDEGPFLKEERNLLINLANIIAGSATRDVLDKLSFENRERLKELKGINLTSQIIAEGKSLEETLQEICILLPKAWQYPNFTVARIRFEGKVYCSRKFSVTRWMQKESFVTIDNKKGTIEISYLKEFPQEYEGPFLKEERQLLINIAKLICGYINNLKGREIYSRASFKPAISHKAEEYRKSLVKDKQPLQLFFNKQIIDKYIYFDMMKFKIKEILFVATLYDAFILENEGHFFEQFMGEIYLYSLFSLPRITGVTSQKEAMELLETTPIDLVILMVGIDQHSPIELSKKIKKRKPDIPIYLLLNQKSNIQYFEDFLPSSTTIDKLFVWNGDS